MKRRETISGAKIQLAAAGAVGSFLNSSPE